MVEKKRCKSGCKGCTRSCNKKRPSKFDDRTEYGSKVKDIDKLFDYLQKRWSRPRMLVDALRESRDVREDDREDWEMVASYLFGLRDALDLDIKSDDIDDMARCIVYGKYELEEAEVIYVKVY